MRTKKTAIAKLLLAVRFAKLTGCKLKEAISLFSHVYSNTKVSSEQIEFASQSYSLFEPMLRLEFKLSQVKFGQLKTEDGIDSVHAKKVLEKITSKDNPRIGILKYKGVELGAAIESR